jgi:signal recognition particle subunit SRP54
MFEQLSDRLVGTFDRLRGKPKVTESDLDEALREIRIALLEADVQYAVVKDLVARVRERAKGQDVLQTISGPQQVVKIVHEELVATLGATEVPLQFASQPPTVVLLVGLQGSGKTTTAAKIASLARKRGRRPVLVAADPYRPAAVQQLVTLAKQLDLPVRTADGEAPPELVARVAAEAAGEGRDVIVADTAGRLHLDDEMMRELERMVTLTHPTEVLLVADAMTGQDAVRAATEFRSRLPLTGLVLTKVDGDARGGAAVSIRAATGVPIKFLGTGEKLDALEPFHPDRLAGRILGMGDVLTLVERAQEHVDKAQAEEQARKFLESRFTLDDFLTQLKQVRKLGPLSQILAMVPGLNQMAKQVPEAEAERELTKIEAIISSMTRAERVDPSIISGSRRKRIAKGSGTSVQDVNQLLKQFVEMQKLMRQMGTMAKGGRLPRFPGVAR